jgi:hypothetical protein
LSSHPLLTHSPFIQQLTFSGVTTFLTTGGGVGGLGFNKAAAYPPTIRGSKDVVLFVVAVDPPSNLSSSPNEAGVMVLLLLADGSFLVHGSSPKEGN